MSASQVDGRTLAERYLTMLNDHDPDGVDGFVAVDYINHNPAVEDGREGNRVFWRDFFIAFPDIETTMDDLIVAGLLVAEIRCVVDHIEDALFPDADNPVGAGNNDRAA